MSALENNKRIAKNTLFLYFRMLFLMCISLYTSRVVLEALGISDYGLYNVVGGFVSMFSLISAPLTSASSRFLNFAMGKGDEMHLKTVFSTSLIVHVILAVIIALLCESFGVWYLNNKMVIPEGRLTAAKWVFQISVLNFCINLTTVPYNGAIIAHEKMSTYAIVSVFEGLARLLICFIVMFSSGDHLILYALLFMSVQVCVMIIYQIYCRRYFEECHVVFVIDKLLIKQMFSYSGWHIIGNSSAVLNRQGVDLVLNYFCGTLLNAARGISNQVMGAVSAFANNFMVAVNPQITKSYAQGEYQYMLSLIFRGARYSYYLLLVLSMPIILNTDYIMHIWLKTIPDYAVPMAQLSLISAMIASLSNPLVAAQNATGQVKYYQIVVGGLQLLNLPLCYVALYLKFSPVSIVVISIIVEIISLMARLIMIPHYIRSFSSVSFIREVVFKAFLVTFSASILPSVMRIILGEDLLSFVIVSSLSILSTLFSVFILGMQKDERELVIAFCVSKIEQLRTRKDN